MNGIQALCRLDAEPSGQSPNLTFPVHHSRKGMRPLKEIP